MSVMNRESKIAFSGPISFEQLQRSLGSLAVDDREKLDQKAAEIFAEEAAMVAEFGAGSPEAARCDELVLLYSMLESHSSLARHGASIPLPRSAEA